MVIALSVIIAVVITSFVRLAIIHLSLPICQGIWINLPWYINVSFGLLFAVRFLLTICFTALSKEMSFACFLFPAWMLSPTCNTYALLLCSSTHQCLYIYVVVSSSYLQPTFLFSRHLYMRGMRPKWYILEPPSYIRWNSSLNSMYLVWTQFSITCYV